MTRGWTWSISRKVMGHAVIWSKKLKRDSLDQQFHWQIFRLDQFHKNWTTVGEKPSQLRGRMWWPPPETESVEILGSRVFVVFLATKALDAFMKCLLFFDVSCSSTFLTSEERYMFPNLKASHVVFLQVWLVDRVVDIGGTTCQRSACPYCIGIQGLGSSCRLGTKLRAWWNDRVDLKTKVKLFGKSGIKTWQSYGL